MSGCSRDWMPAQRVISTGSKSLRPECTGPRGGGAMSLYQFEVATPDADPELRRILAETPMPGRVVVSLLREPSYFGAAVVGGRFHQVIAARDRAADRLIGFGARSIRNMYVNGRV